MLDTRHQPVLESLVERLGSEINAKAVMLLHENGQVIQRHGWMGDHEYPAMAALVAAMIATGKSLSALGESFAGSPSRFACDSEAMGLYMAFVSEGIWLAALYDQPMNPGLFRMKVRRYAEIIGRIGASKPGQAQVPALTLRPAKQPSASPTLNASPTPSAQAPAGASAYPNRAPERPAAQASISATDPRWAGASDPRLAGATGTGSAGAANSRLAGATDPKLARANVPPTAAPVAPSATTQPESFTQQNGGLFNNITDEEIDRLFDDATS